MAQHDFNIANQVPANLRADLNNAFSAIATNSSGASAPSTTFANQWWYDTTNNLLKIRNEADTAWITVGELDQTSGVWKPYVNGKQIADFLDEDDMASDSATAVPSQQSVKAYVDNKAGNFLVVREQHTSGTTGGALTESNWTTYAINTTQYNNISGASVASNQITLPAGTYKVSGYGGASTTFNTTTKSNNFKPRLRNITDGSTALVGGGGRPSGYSGTLSDEMQMPIGGVITLASPKTFELQCYANSGGNANTGRPIASGEVEVYAELVIEKVG